MASKAGTGTKNQVTLQQSYQVFENWADEFKDIFEWKRPEAGAMVYIKYSLPIKSKDLMQKILQDKNILIIAETMLSNKYKQ